VCVSGGGALEDPPSSSNFLVLDLRPKPVNFLRIFDGGIFQNHLQ